MRLGIFGGSFSPPHLGHLRAAEFFAASRRLDRVLIVPTGISPLKGQPTGVREEDRRTLCRLTFSRELFEVNDWELNRPGPSYTIDTLRYVKERYPEAELFLLIGEDQYAQFRQWKDWREILRLAERIVLPRYEKNAAGFAPLPVSSSELREKLAAGEDVSDYLAPQALEYIYERGLYDARRLP